MFFGLWNAELLGKLGFIMFLGLWKAKLLEAHLLYVSGHLESRIIEHHWFYNVFGSLESRIVGKQLVL